VELGEAAMEVTRNIKKAFDPLNIMNPDKVVRILVFVATVAVSLFIFWSYGRGKNGN